MRRVRRLCLFATAGAGMSLLIVTATPVCRWWAAALSREWNEPGGDTLVVLTGDLLDDGTIGVTSYWRSVYCVRAWREGKCKRVIITGDARTCSAMRDFAVWSGVPPSAVTIEENSHNTHESAVHVAEMLRGERGTIALLTSDYHMYRSWRAFRKAGLTTISAPFPDAGKRASDPVERWGIFCRLAAETAGIGYYAIRGWI